MDNILSKKIKAISFLCTSMVVFRHGLNLQAFGLDSYETSFVASIEHGISKITEIAVPYFFIVSGYFFFRYSYYDKNEYITMIRKKIQTLFIPFIFWNIFGIFPLLITHKFVYEDSIWEYFQQLLNSDWNGVLWYVRDIMTMMVLAPIYSWVFVANNKWLYISIFILLFINWWPVDCKWLSSEGMLFFFLGGVLQNYRIVLDRRMPTILLSIVTTIWVISCFCYPFYWPIHRYNTLLGVVIIWQLYCYLPNQLESWIIKVSKYSFFIYVIHIYIIKSMKVGMAYLFYGNETIALISYIILPLLTIMISLYIGKVLNKYIPTVFNFITGGRSKYLPPQM